MHPTFHLQFTTPPTWTLTRMAGVFGPLMAEYILGMIMMVERKFDVCVLQQMDSLW
jgi:hypothetical protein